MQPQLEREDTSFRIVHITRIETCIIGVGCTRVRRASVDRQPFAIRCFVSIQDLCVLSVCEYDNSIVSFGFSLWGNLCK